MRKPVIPDEKNEFSEGFIRGLPIMIGYFSASIAFGLLCRSADLPLPLALAFSMTNFAGASQFMALNLYTAGIIVPEIIVAVFLINLRYFLMSASLFPRLKFRKKWHFPLCAFGATDENFTTAYFRKGDVPSTFMMGLTLSSWSGWVGGTMTGYIAGVYLPGALQDAAGIALFALFAALLVPEVKKGVSALFIALIAGSINSLLTGVMDISAGWAFAVSMLVTAFGAAFILPPKTETREAKESGRDD